MGSDSWQRGAQGLLLDFGAVVSYSIFEIIGSVERRFALEAGSLGWRGPLEPAADPLWQTMQLDEISERQYWETRALELSAKIGRPLSVRDFMVAAYELPQSQIIRPCVSQAVSAARDAGKRVGLLTNELELFHGKPWMNGLDVLRDMDFIIDATHTHILKPDPRAYRLAIDAMALPAEEIVFVDDQKRNADGARQAGMIDIHFDVAQPEASIQRALARLGLADAQKGEWH